MSRYVVTGAAGFIGSHVTETLRAAGHEVVAVDAFTDYYDPSLKEENAAAFDVERIDLEEDAFEIEADGVFHLAGQPGVRPSFDQLELYLRRNVLATQRVLQAAVRAEARVVLASSSSVYGDAETYPTPETAPAQPLAPYGITKLACEHLARAYPLDTVTLRYFTVYGPRQRPDMAFAKLFDAALEGREFELYGDASRSFTYVADAVDATIAAMERAPAGALYNVGGGEEATMRRVVELVSEIAGTEVHLRELPRARGDARRTSADVSRIARELGWQPSTALADGLHAQWRWAAARVAAQ
ncbi:MAG TPA: NAD-dependent epimerase/dehydratase family protein [Gaiellaceae bacterium]|nr:NAD-dependent epimerase/dehydratase family protein [Gaiellaceae bacterium]